MRTTRLMMASLAMCAAALPAFAELAPDTAWEDVPPTNTVRSVVGQFAATDSAIAGMTNATLRAAKKYTDDAIRSAGNVTPEMVTNIVNDVAPAPGNYAAVSNSAMNAIQTLAPATNYTDSATNSLVEAFERDYVNEDTSSKSVQSSEHSAWAYEAGMSQEAFVAYELGPISGDSGEYRHYNEIFEQLDAATSTNAAQSSLLSDIMMSDRTNSANIATLGSQVNAIGAHLNAEDAHFVSTNYDSIVHMPEAYVEVRLNDHGTNSWITIWREMRRWTAFVGSAFDWHSWQGFHAWATNITAQLVFKADRCWGIYDSETGGYSPEGYTQISSPNILVAAGMAYQRTITSGGNVWVLQCNQGTAHIGGDTNGFFRIRDGDGNVQFEIIKGDRQELGADATGITVAQPGNVMTIQYSVEADEHPTIECCDDLARLDWRSEADSDCLCTVSWSGSSGAWVATVTPKTAQPQMFVKATYTTGGETYIRNVGPVGMDSIMLNGRKYNLGTAVINGNTVLTLTAP